MAEVHGLDLGLPVILLGAGVVALPLFARFRLGSVLGYLAAGLVIGPSVLRVVDDPQVLLHVAELGVVMFLFLIGLEMRPRRLLSMKREIFGLGTAQVATCGLLLTLAGIAAGYAPIIAFIGAMGFVLSSTAVIMRMIEERGLAATEEGQRAVAILLFEDLSIVPLLALVALLGSHYGPVEEGARPVWLAVTIALGSIFLVVAAGRWLLNPIFGLLARTGTREAMTAAALLVVLGTAWFMQWGGLSMAMGAFLAGVLLSESVFRHQLEADIEPFRGILLGLFFMSVGMSLDLSLVVRQWPAVVAGVVVAMAIKSAGIFIVARLAGTGRQETIRRSALFAQGGEFAFVLYAAALAGGLLTPETSALLTAIVILSMAVTPLLLPLAERLIREEGPDPGRVDAADGLRGQVLFVGFGRFAQVASQSLLARCVELSLIETDVEMIEAAADFGFKVYYGDGTRLDVLRASGAGKAEAILVCVDKPESADRIVELCRSEFPQAKLYVRAFDRGHSLRLVQAGVDFQIRETFESALAFSREVLLGLGFDPEQADDAVEDTRRRDEERFELELAGGLRAGRWLLRGNIPTPQPEPFVRPPRSGAVVNVDAVPEASAQE
ncbi:monovalent cation:proton antiporter-2 (CPA2) family protein [Sphingosinicella terrae]|uniref:monovalent cation:proton antiporter-2 (CPA2) family protein n=1 Tax=Sphingosinicella terrae TaxID=2172047 RepID=UPI000E0DE81C|nr:monovalent cation:proton antiporter-2 (CPA2) family protein [Sphingosinicella terrae]